MKNIFFPLIIVVLITSSCSSVRVLADYDKTANFSSYQKYAFYKPGIDQAQISDLDKKRILRAIDTELTTKGMSKSEQADILISIFTKESERVEVFNNNFGWGWGWNPWWGGVMGSTVSTTNEGTLYIDFIDVKTQELVWQGVGTADLITSGNVEKKEKRIREIIQKIMEKYPPKL